jgi:hypothetical protein
MDFFECPQCKKPGDLGNQPYANMYVIFVAQQPRDKQVCTEERMIRTHPHESR